MNLGTNWQIPWPSHPLFILACAMQNFHSSNNIIERERKRKIVKVTNNDQRIQIGGSDRLYTEKNVGMRA